MVTSLTFAKPLKKNNISAPRMFYPFKYYLFILLFTYKLIFKDFPMLYIIRKGFCHGIFCYKSYQVTSLELLDTAPLKPGTYRTSRRWQ